MTNFLYDSYVILGKIYSQNTYIKQAISQTPCDPAQKALTVKIVYGVVENDAFLEHIIKQLASKAPKRAIKIILKQALYLIKFADKPVYAVTNEAVALVKKLGKGGVSGFVNAFLRKVPAQEISLPKDVTQRLAVEYSYPHFAVKHLSDTYGQDTCQKIVSYRSDVQSLRYKKEFLHKAAEDKSLIPTVFENVFLTKGRLHNDEFLSGEFTFQSIGSVAVCDIVEPCADFLDACAAPGGKSIYLAEKCANVTAFEIHAHRVELIQSYKKRMCAHNVAAYLKDSTVFDKQYENAFDGVLCDVSCSGLGVTHQNPDIKLGVKQNDILALNKIQAKILSNCSKYVKPGGFLYYSTCSVLEQENDFIVNEFLNNHKNFEVVCVSSLLEHLKMQNGIQFLPHISSGAGFYVSKIRKIK